MTLDNVIKSHVSHVLYDKAQGNMSKASKMLGIGRATLYRYCQKYKLDYLRSRKN